MSVREKIMIFIKVDGRWGGVYYGRFNIHYIILCGCTTSSCRIGPNVYLFFSKHCRCILHLEVIFMDTLLMLIVIIFNYIILFLDKITKRWNARYYYLHIIWHPRRIAIPENIRSIQSSLTNTNVSLVMYPYKRSIVQRFEEKIKIFSKQDKIKN